MRLRWVTGAHPPPRLLATLTGHERELSAVATGTDAAGRPFAVTGGYAEPTVRVWDLATGEQRALLRPSEEDAWAVATAGLAGRPVAVTGSYRGAVQVWDVAGGPPLGRVDAGEGDLVCALAVTELAGRPVVVTSMYTDDGDADTYREWPEIAVNDLATGRLLRRIDTGHTGAVHLAAAVVAGRPVVVTGGSTDTTVRVWDLATGAPAGPPRPGHTGGITALVTVATGGRVVLVAAGYGGVVRRWDLATGAPLGEPLAGPVTLHLAVTAVAGRPAVVAAGRDAVHAWDLATGATVVEPFPARGIGALAAATVDGRPVAVTAMRDATVRVWNLAGLPPAAPAAVPVPAADAAPVVRSAGVVFAGHTDVVCGAAVVSAGGREFAVTAGGELRRWPLVEPAGAVALPGPRPGGVAVSTGPGPVRFVAVAGAEILCWAPDGPPERIATVEGRRLWSVATTVRHGRATAVVGLDAEGWRGEVRLVDLATGAPVGAPLTGHGSFVSALATDVVAGRPVAVAAGRTETTVRVWDLTTGEPHPLTGHDAWVWSVAAGGGQALTGDADGVLRRWDLLTLLERDRPLLGHTGPVNAVAIGHRDGWPMAVSGGDDRTVRLWDLTTGEPAAPAWTFPEPVTALAIGAGGVVVGFGFDVALLDLPIAPS